MTLIKFLFIPLIAIIISSAIVRLSLAQTDECIQEDRHEGLISAFQTTGTRIGNTGGKCALGPQVSYRDFNVPSYSDLENEFYTFSRSDFKKTDQLQPDANGALDFNGNGIYRQNTNMTIRSITGEGVQVIFINGSLTITGDITYANDAPNSGLVFITSGDINIASNVTQVNAVLISASDEVSGALISSGRICTAYNNTPPNPSCLSGEVPTDQLIVNGSLISLNKTPLPGGALLMKRTLTINTDPAEIIQKQPKYLYNLRGGLFTEDLILVQEDKNYQIPEPPPPGLPPTTPPQPPPAGFNPDPNGTLSQGLLSYWKFDETEANKAVAADVKNLNNGTATGTTVVLGKLVNARSFNGTSDLVNLGSGSQLKRLASAPFSVGAWINPTLDSSDRVIIGNTWSQPGWQMRITSGNRLRFIIVTHGERYRFSDTAVLSSGWQYVVGVWNGTSAKTYINGVESSNPVNSGEVSPSISTLNTYIGNNPEVDRDYKGIIDEMGIWNKALTGPSSGQTCNTNPNNEICTLYNSNQGNTYSPDPPPPPPSGANPLSTGLILSYKMEEPSGLTLNDSSGNNNNGTLTSDSRVAGHNGIGKSVYFAESGHSTCGTNNFPTTAPVTLTAWAYFDVNQPVNNADYIVQVGSYNGQFFNIARSEANKVYYVWNDQPMYGPAIPTGQWVHVAMVFNQTAPFVQFYLNGQPQTIAQPGVAISVSSPACAIGRWREGNGHFMNGKIDEVGVWKRALNQSEINSIKNQGLP